MKLISWIKYRFKLGEDVPITKPSNVVERTEQAIEALERSQEPLIRHLDETGFFVGDAYRMKRQKPKRVHHG